MGRPDGPDPVARARKIDRKTPSPRCGGARFLARGARNWGAERRLRRLNGAFAHAFGPDYHRWAALDRLWRLHRHQPHGGGRRQPAHAGDFRRGRRGRAGLSQATVHDHRRRRGHRLHHHRPLAVVDGGDRIRHRSDPVGRRRLHRHERLGARQRAHRAGGDQVARRGPQHRLSRRRGDRASRRRPRAARRRRLFHRADPRPRLRPSRPHHDRRAGRARLRRLAHLDLRPSRRRHLHQGRGRRGRSRRQGRGRHPRGRSSQSGDHRRQRRRQCRRLRRHGRGPVRDLCGHGGGDHGPGLDLLRRRAGPDPRHDLSARHLRDLHRDLDHRHLLRQARRQQLDHGRALQGPRRHRRPVDPRPRHRDNLCHRLGRDRDGRRQVSDRPASFLLRHPRARGYGPHRGHHRILHRHRKTAGRVDRPGFRYRPWHQCDPGPRRVARIRPRCRRWSSWGELSGRTNSPACSALRSRSPPC